MVNKTRGFDFHQKQEEKAVIDLEFSTLRLYTKQNKGGQGLVSIRATVQDKTTKIHEYIRKMALEAAE